MSLARREILQGTAATLAGLGGVRSPGQTGSASTASDPIGVRDFGARGDGLTDDTAAVEQALAAVVDRSTMERAGGVVHFPAGTYRITRPVDVPRNIILSGESPYSTRLQYAGESAAVFLTFGRSGQIAEFSGIEAMWVEAAGRTDVAIQLWGPQEGSRISQAIVTGARRVVVDVRSAGIEGGSNKFVIEKSWLWTIGNSGTAGVRIGAGSGPLSIRDSTCVGTGRSAQAPVGSAGVVAVDSRITLDNLNVEHFENFASLSGTMADIRSPSCFHTTNGVQTTGDQPLRITNAEFDGVVSAVIDDAAEVNLASCRSYVRGSGSGGPDSFDVGSWSIGSVSVYQSETRQARIGYVSAATEDTERFKISSTVAGEWRESAAVDTDGVFGSAGSSWNAAHLRLGDHHLWVDGAGRLRFKNGAPASADDGSVIGG